MSSRSQSQVVYAAALVQGIALVTFPAASTIFTSGTSYGLSSSQYGAMFLPQAITAVGSSLLQGSLSHRLGGKPVYLAGLCANLAAMILLIASPLRRAGLTLPDLYGVSAVVAVALGLLSLAVAHRRPSPRSVHPRPQPLETPQSAPELIS
jgi:MFS-type transporter involved in bile tolerance (Atg22 family)